MNRRDMLKLTTASALAALASGQAAAESTKRSVYQYDIFEIALAGPSGGNPFREIRLNATFSL
jgi:hypothetical protein